MWAENAVQKQYPYATNIVDGRTVQVKSLQYGAYEAYVEMSGPVVGTLDGFSLSAWTHPLHEGTLDECVEFFALFLSQLRKVDGSIYFPDVSSTPKTEEQQQRDYEKIPY